MTRALIVLLLSGCASFGQPFVREPGNMACVQVHWTRQDIQAHCPKGADACATTHGASSLNHIYAERPVSFDDAERVRLLGHEFLHALGARHE